MRRPPPLDEHEEITKKSQTIRTENTYVRSVVHDMLTDYRRLRENCRMLCSRYTV